MACTASGGGGGGATDKMKKNVNGPVETWEEILIGKKKKTALKKRDKNTVFCLIVFCLFICPINLRVGYFL